ncbi:triphosphoribosyl-dephospho-CoA synthase [Rhodoferax sp. OV413]|uniref:triphosphoribosyl-dephospho-CoA synthase MdcB n=1 Tax=Rhodoferax sp. OV413 TaxID=1855285 RepID=UPI00088527C2|nr:triphosphoribosyl-dephospho-CoA synthase MdcB [Rhodoferax sp. OV413]SDP83284.1 triphosphoribosyl-dephospho-CoA synthase [Rhodoferax sp. OV413]
MYELASIGQQAVRALYLELALEPKPGLVSLRDNGSHQDMTAQTFVRSLFALRHYFVQMAHAGAAQQPFSVLETLGLQAEVRMLRATGGINTHRGAIFALGLLCASAGSLQAQHIPNSPQALRTALSTHWGPALRSRAERAHQRTPTTNGQRAAQRYQLRSAGDEAADAFPTLFETTLPALQAAYAQGLADRAARIQAFFATMACLDDTNMVHRGGMDGLHFGQQAARRFLAAGGAARPDWLEHARALHAAFVARRLSPGGSADLLACACWVQQLSVSAAQPQACLT